MSFLSVFQLKNYQYEITFFSPLSEGERPLFLTLLWGAAHSGHGFRLKDRMDHEPVWHDFKEAELESFLRMFQGVFFIIR